MTLRKYDTIAGLMDAYKGGQLDGVAFNDELWQMLVVLVHSPRDRQYGDPPLAYFASQYLEYEVGNGGFAQAAYNMPEWFEAAAWGYDCLGRPKAAALIREALSLLTDENRDATVNARDIGDLFEQFSESKLAELDRRLEASDWWATEARLGYIREHEELFRAIR